MADSPAAAEGPAGGETPAQLKARLRRERLAAKSGASRLQQISALQGGPPKTLSEIQKDLPGMYALYSLDMLRARSCGGRLHSPTCNLLL